MFGRESLREFLRGENESFREFLRRENESFREFLLGENESFREFLQGENESLRELVRDRHAETTRKLDELQEFNREILLRNEKVYTSVIAEMAEAREEIRANTERTRAGTQAILRLLDRFDDAGGAPA